MTGKIAIIGAGAKAAAIVARVATLRSMGFHVPDIVVFESEHIGSAWSGDNLFSSGFLTLCTPGEKDVGFPYDENALRGNLKVSISSTLHARFSWGAFLVDMGNMSDWVDRGRDHPSHRDWATYLKWVFEKASHDTIHAKVTHIASVDAKWKIFSDQPGGSTSALFDGVVLTGTGSVRKIPAAPDIPVGRLLDAETFWPARTSVRDLEEGAIAVAGDGGSAGTIVAWLAQHFEENRSVSIYSINPMGTFFQRGDGHAERRWFSDPSDWSQLYLDHRRKLIDRTEAGVISARIKSVIDRSSRIQYHAGRALEARWDDIEQEVVVDVSYDDNKKPPLRVQYLVSAIGFDSWNLLHLVDHPNVASLLAPGSKNQRDQVEVDMMADLSLPPISGLPSGLHVPALAGLARGPGMGNLGCLGLMASAVLEPYLAGPTK